WKGVESWAHLAVMLAVGAILVERSLAGFRKMPFACAYLPGESNLRMKFPMYAGGFLFGVDIGTNVERAMFDTLARSALFAAALVFFVAQARRKWRAFADGPFELLQFDPIPKSEVAPLTLSGDGEGVRALRYLDVIDALPEPRFRERVFVFA